VFDGRVPSDELIPIPADAAAREALLHRVEALGALDHPRVEPVLAVEVRADGNLVVRRGPGAAADLPAVLAVRGRLSAHEAAGLLVATAQGLAALHSQAMAHGGVGARDVVLGADGVALLRPRLVADRAAGAPGAADLDAAAAQDVHELAGLVADLLGDRTDDAAVRLRAVLAPALAPDPLVRPEAGTLAAHADSALDPEPVRLPERAQLAAAALGAGRPERRPAGGVPQRTSSARRRTVGRPGRDGDQGAIGAGGHEQPPRGRHGARHQGRAVRVQPSRPGATPALRAVARAAGVVGAVAVVAGLGAAVLEASSPGEASTRVVPAGPAGSGAAVATPARAGLVGPAVDDDPDDPASAAVALTQRRVALLSGDGTVEAVDLPGSPAHVADTDLVARMARAGTRVDGVEVVVHRADLAGSGAGGEARVTVEYEIGAHVQRDADGTSTTVPTSGRRTAVLGLAWTDGGWRVETVD